MHKTVVTIMQKVVVTTAMYYAKNMYTTIMCVCTTYVVQFILAKFKAMRCAQNSCNYYAKSSCNYSDVLCKKYVHNNYVCVHNVCSAIYFS